MKILHINSSLNIGGAERMLLRLIESNPENFTNTMVISLTTLGEIGVHLREQGICIRTLKMSSILHFPLAIFKLIKIIKEFQPDVIQTWLYHADLLGGIAALLAGKYPVIWNIRSTAIPQGKFSITFWLIRFCSIFSYFIPTKIICCAISIKKVHVDLGFDIKKMVVIPNGYDFSLLQKNLISRIIYRQKLGFSDTDLVIGVIGRFDPLKDFKNFIYAAGHVHKNRQDIKFLMVGRGNNSENKQLNRWIKINNLQDYCLLVDQQVDIPGFLSAMDIFCLSSSFEGFPNVLVEAMALGLPCVSTKAGDAEIILDDSNFTVSTQDPIALSKALLLMCSLDKQARYSLGAKNLQKVMARYDIKAISKKYYFIYENISNNNINL